MARRATRVHTVEQKKKGIAGFFGRKEEIRIMPSSKELHAFSDSLIVMQERQTQEMDIYADSLRMRNMTLNKALNELINNLDKQIQSAFTQRERQTDEAKKTSFRMFAIIIVIAVVLLMLSFFIIRSDLRNEEKIKLRLKQAIRENEDLLEMRKRIILTVSHDIRGPLGNIHNCADLASDTREKKKREIYLDDIRHSCHHILHLVNPKSVIRISQCCMAVRNPLFFPIWKEMTALFLKTVPDKGYAFLLSCPNRLALISTHNGWS